MSTLTLNRRYAQVRPSSSIAAKARVDALRAQGRRIVDFSIGEPDFDTPAHLVEAGVDALRSGATRYTGSLGTPALRAAAARKFERENGLPTTAQDVVVGVGAKQLIFHALMATLNDGDEVVVPAPYWVSYPDMVRMNGGVPVIVPTDARAGFILSPAALEAAIGPRTRWLLLNTPNNPTGAVYGEADLRLLAEVLRRHPHVWILTDEIYEHFVFGAARHHSLTALAPDLADRCFVVNGVSKAYAMTGWRIGYGRAPRELVDALGLVASQTTTCASAASQVAATLALDGPQDCVHEARRLFEQRRDRIAARLNAIDGIRCTAPSGAFYAFADVCGLLGRQPPEGPVLADDPAVGDWLLDAAGVSSVAGSAYGAPGFLRLSFATSLAEIDAGCDAIASAVASLR